MYTNEFCGLRIQIPEGERVPETKIQEAKQKMEEILHYASYCAHGQKSEQKNINIAIRDNKQSKIFLSIFVQQNDVYAAAFILDKQSKKGILSNHVDLKDVCMIDQLRAENRICNYVKMEKPALEQGYGLESAWEEYITRLTKEREHTKDTHYDEYARMEHPSAKRNAERKFPVQQNRVSTSRRPPSPVPVPPSGTRPSARTPENGSLSSPAAGHSERSADRADRLRKMMESKNPEAVQNYIEEAKERARQRSAAGSQNRKDRNVPRREAVDGRG